MPSKSYSIVAFGVPQPFKPSKEDLIAARGKSVRDVIAPGLRVLFCGINPGLYTAAVGHHFARPGNRFWPALYASGFTTTLLSPFQEGLLLQDGYGITNIVARATASAAEISPEEFVTGGRLLRRKVLRYKPAILAVLGLGAYRSAFGIKDVALGPQSLRIGESRLWVLPNPSGLNAHYQRQDMAELFRELKLIASRKV